MAAKEFQFTEDPDRPGRLLYKLEYYEIGKWTERREWQCWQRLIAFNLMYGALIVALMRLYS